MARKYKADIFLGDRKTVYHFNPTREELDIFLNDTSDIVLTSMIEDRNFYLRVTNNVDGIIYDFGIKPECFRQLYHKLFYEM